VGLFRKKPKQYQTKIFGMVPLAGLEPARCEPPDFESGASTNSATGAFFAAQAARIIAAQNQGSTATNGGPKA